MTARRSTRRHDALLPAPRRSAWARQAPEVEVPPMRERQASCVEIEDEDIVVVRDAVPTLTDEALMTVPFMRYEEEVEAKTTECASLAAPSSAKGFDDDAETVIGVRLDPKPTPPPAPKSQAQPVEFFERTPMPMEVNVNVGARGAPPQPAPWNIMMEAVRLSQRFANARRSLANIELPARTTLVATAKSLPKKQLIVGSLGCAGLAAVLAVAVAGAAPEDKKLASTTTTVTAAEALPPVAAPEPPPPTPPAPPVPASTQNVVRFGELDAVAIKPAATQAIPHATFGAHKPAPVAPRTVAKANPAPAPHKPATPPAAAAPKAKSVEQELAEAQQAQLRAASR